MAGVRGCVHGLRAQTRGRHERRRAEALVQDQRLIRHWGKLKFGARQRRGGHQAGRSSTAAWAPGSQTGRATMWSACGTISPSASRSWAATPAPISCAWSARTPSCSTSSAISALNDWDAFEGTPKSKADRVRIQEVFNAWVRASSRPLCQVSMIRVLGGLSDDVQAATPQGEFTPEQEPGCPAKQEPPRLLAQAWIRSTPMTAHARRARMDHGPPAIGPAGI